MQLVESPRFSGVMHVFTALGRGGAELRTLDVVRRSGLRFGFLSASGRAGTMDETVLREGHFLRRLRVRGPLAIVRAAMMMRRDRVTVLHSHLGVASGEVLVSAWLARVPVRIAHCRSDGVGGRTSVAKSAYLTISRMLVRTFATEIVAVSPSALQGSGLLRGRWRERARVLSNGVDADALRARSLDAKSKTAGSTTDRFVVAHVARAEPDKNRTRAIQVWANLARRQSSTLKLVGAMTDEEFAFAKVIAEDPAVQARSSQIEIIGETSNVAEHLGLSDALLVTSSREGLPGVVLEALACGTPVVGTDLPGILWIQSRTSGVVVRSLDDDNEVWVQSLLTVPTDRQAIFDAFAASPFQLHSAARAHMDLWGLRPEEFPSALRFFSLVKLHRDSLGRYRAHTPLMSNEEWAPFLRHFESIEVFTRVTSVRADDTGYLLDDDRIRIYEIPFYDGWREYLRRLPEIRRFLRESVLSDRYAYGLWAPSQIAPYLTKRIARNGSPLLVRLIGDPQDVAKAIVRPPLGALIGTIACLSTRATVRRASAVVYVTLNKLQRKYPARTDALILSRTNLKLVPEVFDVKRNSYKDFASGGPVRLIAVGSQQQNYKGHDILIDAVASLRSDGHDLQLTLIGQGAQHDALVARAHASQLDVEFIRHAGTTLDVARMVAQRDIFVMPSRTEGMPKALLEAMAVGTFALGASVGGIEEVLHPEHRFAPGDARALAERLRFFLLHRGEVERGREAQRRVFNDIWEHHSGPDVLDDFLARWTTGEPR